MHMHASRLRQLCSSHFFFLEISLNELLESGWEFY